VEIGLTIVFALVGLAVGSFLNVCIDRLPQNKSIAYPQVRYADGAGVGDPGRCADNPRLLSNEAWLRRESME
jgi:prepilin signal peptidase PulO-like enzyme (type II secretory pathway)